MNKPFHIDEDGEAKCPACAEAFTVEGSDKFNTGTVIETPCCKQQLECIDVRVFRSAVFVAIAPGVAHE